MEEVKVMEETIIERIPAAHPGDTIREDFMEPLGMTPYRLAKGLHISQTAVSQILQGKRSITPATALRLSKFLGWRPEIWLGLQNWYDLEMEKERLKDELEKIVPFSRSDLDKPVQQTDEELQMRKSA